MTRTIIDGIDVPGFAPKAGGETSGEKFIPGQTVAVGRNGRVDGRLMKGPDGERITVIERGWRVESVDSETGTATVVSPDGAYEKTYTMDALASVQERARQEAGEDIAERAVGFAASGESFPAGGKSESPEIGAESEEEDPFVDLSEGDRREVEKCLEYLMMKRRAAQRGETDNVTAWENDLSTALGALSVPARNAYFVALSQKKSR